MNRVLFQSTLLSALIISGIAGVSSPGLAIEPKKQEPASKSSEPKTGAMPPVDARGQMTDIEKFCMNNAATAGDARAAWQAAKLTELEDKIKQRIVELDAKRAEYQEWLTKRNEAMKKAEDGVVAIYSKMRPDAAALQLSAMDESMAAALLMKLSPKNASLILNEIEPGRAARLTNAMVGTNASADGKKS